MSNESKIKVNVNGKEIGWYPSREFYLFVEKFAELEVKVNHALAKVGTEKEVIENFSQLMQKQIDQAKNEIFEHYLSSDYINHLREKYQS